MSVHVTKGEALARAAASLGKIGLPQPWAPWGRRAKTAQDGVPNDCMFFASWLLKDNGGRARSDYRNGSIRAFRADRDPDEYRLITDLEEIVAGDLLLLRWDDGDGDALPDHVGIVTSVPEAGRRWNTIEANTGPSVGVYTPCGVHRRTRFRANVVGAIRPPYLKGA